MSGCYNLLLDLPPALMIQHGDCLDQQCNDTELCVRWLSGQFVSALDPFCDRMDLCEADMLILF